MKIPIFRRLCLLDTALNNFMWCFVFRKLFFIFIVLGKLFCWFCGFVCVLSRSSKLCEVSHVISSFSSMVSAWEKQFTVFQLNTINYLHILCESKSKWEAFSRWTEALKTASKRILLKLQHAEENASIGFHFLLHRTICGNIYPVKFNPTHATFPLTWRLENTTKLTFTHIRAIKTRKQQRKLKMEII